MALSFFKKPEPKSAVFTSKKESELLDILLQKGYLNPVQYKAIEEESARLQKGINEILNEKRWVSDDKLALAYSLLYGVPVVHIPLEPIAQEVLATVPQDTAAKFQIIPFGKLNGSLKVGIVDPFKLTDSGAILELFEKNRMMPTFYIIPRSDFRRALVQYTTSQTGVFSPIDLSQIQIPYEIVSKLPKEIAEKYQMLIFDYTPGHLLKAALVNPTDQKVLEILNLIGKRTGLKIEKYITDEEDLKKALKAYEKEVPPKEKVVSPEIKEKPDKTEVMIETVGVPLEEDLSLLLKKDVKDLKELEEIVKGGHVPKIVAALINFACKERATDIHVQPYEKDVLIRYRVDGLLRDIIHVPKDLHPAIISRIKILSKLKIDEQRIPQDGRFDLKFHERSVDIRVSTLPTSNGEKVVLRILDKSFGILTLEQLGLQGQGFKNLIREIEKPFGVVLATGPTGCGKTTTLYAILNRIKNPTVNIVTLEDPVEYEIEGINQSQIRPEIGYSFATGLRSILRQDPNVMMVGEIRDAETASLVTHAALTGHLVLTTLHTNEASAALPRLINMGVEPFLITSAVNVIIAQRLLRKVCQKCQEPVNLTGAVIDQIKKEIAKMPKGTIESLNLKRPFPFRKGKGCDECDNGYRGRIAIFEVLVMSSNIEELAIRKRPSSEILGCAQKEGMLTMKQDGIIKVLQGITTYNEVLRVIATD